MRNNTSINEVPGTCYSSPAQWHLVGSSRIISLGCVRAANNSLLFPAPGTDNVSLMTTGEEEDRRNARSFRTVCQLPRQASVDADACRRDRAGLPMGIREIGHVDLESRSTYEINRLRARLPEESLTEVTEKYSRVTRCIQ